MNNLAVPSESIILFLELIEDLHDEEIVPGCRARQQRQAGATILQFKQNRPSPLTLLSLMDSCCLYTTCNRIIRKTAPLCRLHSPKHGRSARGGDSRAGTLTGIYFLIFRALHDHSSQPPGVTDHDLGPNNDLLCNSKVRRVPVAS